MDSHKIIELKKILNQQNVDIVGCLKIIESTDKNLNGAMKNLTKFSRNQIDPNENLIAEASRMTDSINQYVDTISKISCEKFSALTTDVENYKIQVAKLKKENQSLRSELNSSLQAAKKSENEAEEQKKKLEGSLTYQAAIGSIFGEMLWKISLPDAIEKIVTNKEGDTLRDFILLANMTFDKFFDDFKDQLPPASSFEFKFVSAFLGVFVNISAHPSGRNFIVKEEEGVRFVVKCLEQLLGASLKPEGHVIKRLALIFIYNIAISKNGARICQFSEVGTRNIFESCICDSEDTPEVQIYATKLLSSLINAVPSDEFNNIIQQIVSLEKLQAVIENIEDEHFKEVAEKFRTDIANIQKTNNENDKNFKNID